jgi:cell division protein FtsB
MTIDQIQPDINLVIGELTLQIANLSRENAILKATIQALQSLKKIEKITDGGELQD